MSNLDLIKEKFIPSYKNNGSLKFYKFLLVRALNKLVLIEKGEDIGESPNLEYLNYYDIFIILYRREGETMYLDIARIFRKVAHKIYRVMLKKNMTPPNRKFLSLV